MASATPAYSRPFISKVTGAPEVLPPGPVGGHQNRIALAEAGDQGGVLLATLAPVEGDKQHAPNYQAVQGRAQEKSRELVYYPHEALIGGYFLPTLPGAGTLGRPHS